MIRSTYKVLFALVLASTALTSANAQLFKAPIHLHPTAGQTDDRVTLRIRNENTSFSEVVVNGKTYEVRGHQAVVIKAPAGTVVYAGYGITRHKKGSVLTQMDVASDGKTITLG